MPIPVTIVLTKAVSGIVIYDHNGSEEPLHKGGAYPQAKEIELGSVNSDNCSPPAGSLEIEAQWPGDPPEKWEKATVPVVEGKNNWPPVAKAQPPNLAARAEGARPSRPE
jgi:hypothetical protein